MSFTFCLSQAFTVLLSNALRVAAINCVGDFVLFLGKLMVVAITAAIGVAIMGVSTQGSACRVLGVCNSVLFNMGRGMHTDACRVLTVM